MSDMDKNDRKLTLVRDIDEFQKLGGELIKKIIHEGKGKNWSSSRLAKLRKLNTSIVSELEAFDDDYFIGKVNSAMRELERIAGARKVVPTVDPVSGYHADICVLSSVKTQIKDW